MSLASSISSSIQPTGRRWIILVIIFFATVVNYFDRQILSVLKPLLKESYNIGDDGYAVIVNVFTVCYAAMYPVTGWLVDRFGPKLVMFFSILGWSVASIGGGLSATIKQFTFFRGMLGIAEPAIFPVKLRTVTSWFSGKLRATANSLCESGSSIGALIAPPVAAWIAIQYSWQAVFIVGGAAGLIIAILWIIFYRNPPASIALENTGTAKIDTSPAFKWGQLWTKKSLWGVLLIRLISDPVWYFCLFWFPGYLQENMGLSLAQMGMVGWIPFLLADLGAIGASAWSDKMVRQGKAPLQARRIMLTCFACIAPICLLTPLISNAYIGIAIFSLVAIMCLSWLFNINIVVAETFPVKNVAGVLGIAGGFGAVGAIVLNYSAGQLLGNLGAEKIFLTLSILHPIAVSILWTMIKKEKPSADTHN
ncbi:MFS transporter [Sphingobacterium chuzhouense]|uniref:MFS transporter n=1 Tax=Sphingobacterium chuzhouense TaxID=1742264 RepID=A0ABR7XPI0_9SPHI|nr:MFS transporter [Sphingobacterium chuzhouense]MBD1420182.1 MFS transporter [Sphingobacterium chuzhouense]